MNTLFYVILILFLVCAAINLVIMWRNKYLLKQIEINKDKVNILIAQLSDEPCAQNVEFKEIKEEHMRHLDEESPQKLNKLLKMTIFELEELSSNDSLVNSAQC